jgi:hypothetical protein
LAEILPPFSNRNRGAHRQIDSDFPESARTGLLHLLHDLVEKQYVGGWIDLARELERIARRKPVLYNKDSVQHLNSARVTGEELLVELPWDNVYDFCQRLCGSLAKEVISWVGDDEFAEPNVDVTLGDVQEYIANEINRLFLEESLAFEFRKGLVERRGRHHTTTQVSRAYIVLGDPRLESARNHFNKGLRYFRLVSQPDYENAVKEAVCAVEATARALFPDSGAKTLGDIVTSITGTESGKLPKALAKTFHGLYGFRSGGEGVAHGGATGGAASQDLAEYVLAIAASQIILLVDLANSEEADIPF